MREVRKGWVHSTLRVEGEVGPAHGALWAEHEMAEKAALGQGWTEELGALLPACSVEQQDGAGVMSLRTLLPVLTEKELALGLLQTAVAQLLPQGLVSIPTEKLLNQLQDVQEPPPERQQLNYRWASPLPLAPLFPELLPHVQHLSFQARLVGYREGSLALARAGLTACPGGRGQPLPGDPPGSWCCSEAPSASPDSAASRGVPEGATCVSCSKTGLEELQLALRELSGKTQ